MNNLITYKKRVVYILVVAVMLGLFLLMRQPWAANWYGTHLYPHIAASLSRFSGLFPLSLYDITITALLAIVPVLLLLICFRKLGWKKALRFFVGSLVVVAVWFYAAWGINYFRPNFYARTNIPEVAFDSSSFKRFLTGYIDSLNAAYCKVQEIDLDQVDCAIEASYNNMHHVLNIPYPCGKRRTKKMIFERLFTRSGISGYYGPLFSEVHVNFYPTAVEIPFTLAHEKAHQFGVTNESECNLFAYVTCTTSADSVVRYSGYLGGMAYVFSNASKLFPDSIKSYIAQVDPRVMADYRTSAERWREGINKTMSETQSKVYDAYLKSNNVKSGVKSYSEMVGLLVSWEQYQITE